MTDLDTQARLTDIRLRVLNNERVSADEFRALLDDLRHERDSAARLAAKDRRTAKRASAPAISLDTLFPTV